MKVLFLMVAVLIAPFFLYFYMGQKTLGAFVGLYVLFSLPSMYMVVVDVIKSKKLPKIVSGPGFQFGKWKL